ncbi:MAG: Gfo/Idh/MocA family oxidoreductase [Gemmatimonadota bacterium]
MTDSLRLGIIGAGAVFQVAHLPVLRKLKGVELAGFCDADLAKARALASRHGVANVYDDIEDLFTHESPDAVLICTPNHLHEVHTLTALAAGAHVLVEKPFALSVRAAERVARQADKSGKVVMVGVNHRYRSDSQAIRSFVQSGELGALDSLQAGWHMARPSRAPLGWRQRREESGGGAMLDLGLTLIDLCLWLAGNPTPVRVSASLGGRSERSVEQSGCALIHCEGGLSVFVDVTWRHIGEGEHFGAGVRGAKGSASMNPLRVWKEMHGVTHDVSPTSSLSREGIFQASFRAQWAHFLAAIDGKAPVPPLEEAVTALRVLEAIYRSATEGQDITL